MRYHNQICFMYSSLHYHFNIGSQFELWEAMTAIKGILTLFKKHKSLDRTLENKRKEPSRNVNSARRLQYPCHERLRYTHFHVNYSPF